MGRKKIDQKQPPPAEPAAGELPFSEAVAHGLAALGKDATPSEVEKWVKAHHLDVWMRIKEPSVIVKTVEAEREKLKVTQPEATNGMSQKKKASENQADRAKDLALPTARGNGREEAPAEGRRKASSQPRVAAANERASKRTRHKAPARDFEPDSLESSVSGRRRQKKEAGGSAAIAVPAPRALRQPGTASCPTVDDLRRVRTLAGKEGGVADLRQTVGRVARLAELVGGLDCLVTCLDVLEEFGVK